MTVSTARAAGGAGPGERPGQAAAGDKGLCEQHVTGLILAGGQGTRMGGRDKGLVPWRGRALVAHVHARFAPQVARVLVSANRNRDAYAAYGEVVADAPELAGFQGPLAGVASALPAVDTGWLAVAPCDAPLLPTDMVVRLLAAAQAAGARLAVAEAAGRRQPVCMVLSVSLRESLLAYLREGGRRVDDWQRREGAVAVPFDDAQAFFNVNTPEDMGPSQQPDATGP